MNDNKNYQIYVKDHGYVSVDKEVYIAYYKHKEHNRYLLKKARECTISYEQQYEFGLMYDYLFVKDDASLLDQLAETERMNKLYAAIAQLDEDEQSLIFDIFFRKRSEREVANALNLTQQAIHYRKKKVLKRLKDILTNEKS